MRSRATFVELLCGCLISPEGWVTRAISAITRGCHWQSQQADYHAGVGAQPGARDDEQACPATVRCLVHASAADIATAVAKNANHWTSTVRYRIVLAAKRSSQTWARASQNLRDQNHARYNPESSSNRN